VLGPGTGCHSWRAVFHRQPLPPLWSQARTTTGRLLASFRKEGVFEYEGGTWKKRAAHPNPAGTGEYWIYLAADAERTAIAITPKDRAPSRIWFGSDEQLRELRLPGHN
jgi:hypothetical protein